MAKVVTTASYKERLGQLGKVELLEEYVSAKTPVLHRCLVHGEEHLAQPTNMLSGGGLKCCKVAGRAKQAANKRNKAAEQYTKKLAELGRVEALEDYVTATSKIKHRCLVHGEVHLTTPHIVLRGVGLKCCAVAAARKTADLKNCRARDEYEDSPAAIGKVIPLEPFVDSHTAILHTCLTHGETHKAEPAKIVAGGGLLCCRGGCTDSYEDFKEDGIKASSPCYVYIARIGDGYLKPGIAKDAERRADRLYNSFVFQSDQMTRAEAWVIEQCLLSKTRDARPVYLEDQYIGWGGWTELRLEDVYTAEWYINTFNALLDELAVVGWEELYQTHLR
jgi:hypothetical protein